MKDIKLYNIALEDCVVKLAVDKIVSVSDIKEIIWPDTPDKYNEFGSSGCCKVYLYSDDKPHYALAYSLKGVEV